MQTMSRTSADERIDSFERRIRDAVEALTEPGDDPVEEFPLIASLVDCFVAQHFAAKAAAA